MAMAVPSPIDRVAVKLTSTTGTRRVAGSRETEAPKRHQISPLSEPLINEHVLRRTNHY